MLAASIVIFILYFCLLVYYVLSIITSIVMLNREHISFQDCWCAAYSSEHEVQNLSPESTVHTVVLMSFCRRTQPIQVLHITCYSCYKQ